MYTALVLDIRHFGELYCDENPDYAQQVAVEILHRLTRNQEVAEWDLTLIMEDLDEIYASRLSARGFFNLLTAGLLYADTAQAWLQSYNVLCMQPFRHDIRRFILIV